MHTPLAIGCATVAAIALGLAGRFQHGAVNEGAVGGRLAMRQVLSLLRHPRWLLGTAMALFGVGLHLVALGLAPLAVVQPIGVLSLATIVLAGSSRYRADKGTWAAVAATSVGAAGFVFFASHVAGNGRQDSPLSLTIQVVVLGVLVLTGLAALSPATARCIGFAMCAAALFGLTSALMRSVLQELFAGRFEWWLPLIAGEASAIAILGGLLVQQAYAARPPAVVLGTITVGDPLTAVIVGMVLCGEAANLTAGTVAGELVCATIAVAGVIALARRVPRTTVVTKESVTV